MNKKTLLANGLLLLTAFIWGLGFVSQRAGMAYVGPFTFNGSRFLLAALVLVPVTIFINRSKKAKEADLEFVTGKKKEKKRLLLGGVCCGTMLFCGSSLQQIGLVYTTASKSAFITALYIVLVPLFSLFLGHRPGIRSWIGVFLGAIGLYMLCMNESFHIATGDLVVLVGALFWTGHVLCVDHFLGWGVDSVKLSLLQFSFCTIVGFLFMFLFEDPSIEALKSCALLIFYSGCLSAGVGFTLQIIGQKYTSPTVASLLMSMESVFGALAGVVILHEHLTGKELGGCIFMFSAIIISQLPAKLKHTDTKPDALP